MMDESPVKTWKDELKHTLQILTLGGRKTSLILPGRTYVYRVGEFAGVKVKS